MEANLKKGIRATDAKEVGLGMPAEETLLPESPPISPQSPIIARDFFAIFSYAPGREQPSRVWLTGHGREGAVFPGN